MNRTDDSITQLSSLYERLGAVAHELEYCIILLPEHSEQLDLDAAATYAMMLRIEQWAANVKNAYNTNTYDPFHINEKDKQLRNQEEENQY
ncbi:hypothetical protein K9T19_003460 [Salmonella enterica subsp. enterica serovar Typhi]|uniref:Uncharacterized protein n=1 Tax=Salmonella typhimurium TaxID=90371 RepID=A0A740M9T9_SALTM|nr:hypothetical protein [Salmonella enterica]EIC6450203.1 hypothetical protein [Salmonella enterica subsp. enterica serovar Typhimurium]EIE2695326.1 hypothetical protein [Salmonella enterica subsp. enterica serovar Typhi]MBX0129516.1 hypothetical protein [Salmonella enterica subsp. enterica serovar Typhi]MBX0145092.1 hypothetical protein [Salmonella enterica subsp. enterica serovar Typhi]MBX0149535.1 hypothetical protein [Salmonella enterica subsp. enterica serovar Typhi]